MLSQGLSAWASMSTGTPWWEIIPSARKGRWTWPGSGRTSSSPPAAWVPTCDDLTKNVLAEAFGRKLVYDEESLERIKAYGKATGRL